MERYITDIVEFTGKRPEPFEGMKKYISTGALILSNIDNNAVELIEYFSRPSRADLEVNPGDLVFAKMSNTDKRLIINEETSKYIYSTGFFAVKAKQGVITTKCLYYLLGSKNFLDQKDKNSTGATQRAITIDGLSKIKVRIPDYISQKNIEIILELLDEIVKLRKNQINEYDQLIKSRFVEMFGQCDLNKRQNNWFKLGDVTEIVTGTTPSTHIEENWNGKHLWITPAEIKDDSFYIYDTERKLSDIGLSSKSLRVMPINTVLLSTRAPIGKTAIVGKPMTCNQGFKNFICKDKLNPIFLYILLKFNTDYLNSIGSGTTFKEISKTVVSNIEIPVPPIELQNEFASFVKQVDKLKFENEILYSIYRFTINKQTKLLSYRGLTL